VDYKFLGRTGVKVSQLCFGTMSFGDEADEEMSGQLYRRCRDAGINFFDCANMYSTGGAEEILGRLISGHRNEIVLTSKAYFPMGQDPNSRGSSRYHLFNSVEDSLRRLNTDRIDIFFLHRFDDYTALEETCAPRMTRHMGKAFISAPGKFAQADHDRAWRSDLHGWLGLPSFSQCTIWSNAWLRWNPSMAESEDALRPTPVRGGQLSSSTHGARRKRPPGAQPALQHRNRDEWMHKTAKIWSPCR